MAPLILQLAGEQTAGTITWMCDERATSEHIVPRITAAAEGAGRPAPRVVVGLPIAVHDDDDEPRARAAKLFAVYAQIRTYQRILERGEGKEPADVCIVGDEQAVTRKLASAGLRAPGRRRCEKSRRRRASRRGSRPAPSSLRR